MDVLKEQLMVIYLNVLNILIERRKRILWMIMLRFLFLFFLLPVYCCVCYCVCYCFCFNLIEDTLSATATVATAASAVNVDKIITIDGDLFECFEYFNLREEKRIHG